MTVESEGVRQAGTRATRAVSVDGGTVEGRGKFSLSQTQTASNRTPRQINRNLIFNLVRTRQPISRADLARVSGLQRSTISLIAEDLIHEGWIIEGSVGTLPRGRRPTFLELNPKRAMIAIDIHPARTTIAVADLAGRIVTQQVLEVPEEANQALKVIVDAIRRMLKQHAELTFEGIGVCLPGRADLHGQKLIFAPNLRWPVLGLKGRMERATGLRVSMDNVANACALAEVWFGLSAATHDLVVVNVSEGIGTGIFANGRLLRGESGMAGEFGHVQLQPNGPLCACGNHGCWETLASNRAAVRAYRAAGEPELSFAELMARALAGDRAAGKALRAMAHALGSGIRMISAALAPREIVVVGEITEAWSLAAPIIEGELNLHPLARVPRLRAALDGGSVRLRSAVALVMAEDSEWAHHERSS